MSSELVTYINELSEPQAALDDIKQLPYAGVLVTEEGPNTQGMHIEQLVTMLKTALFINAHTTSIIDDFIWKLGESKETADKFVTLTPNTHEYRLKPDVPGYIVQALESKIGHKQPFTSIELSLRYTKPNLHLAAKCGNVRLFRYWLYQDEYPPSYVFTAASQHPQVFAVLPEATRSKVPKSCRIDHLMPRIHLNVYKQLMELKSFYKAGHIVTAARFERVDIINFLIEEKQVLPDHINYVLSVPICELLFLKFGDCKGFRTYIETEVEEDTMSHRPEVLKYLHSQGISLHKNVVEVAFKKDDQELYKLMRPGDEEIPKTDIHKCINAHSINCLEYLLSRKVEIKSNHVQLACTVGNPQILRVILDKVPRVSGLKVNLETAINEFKKSRANRQNYMECINILVDKIRSFRYEMKCGACGACGSKQKLRFCAQCRVTVFCSEKCQQIFRYKHEDVCKARTIPIYHEKS